MMTPDTSVPHANGNSLKENRFLYLMFSYPSYIL